MGRYVFFRLDINKYGKEDAWVELGSHTAEAWKKRINSYEGHHVPRHWDGTFWYVAAYEGDAGVWYLVNEDLKAVKVIAV